MFQELTIEEFIEHNKSTNSKLNTSCPIRKTLALFHGKWKSDVLFELSKHQVLRFGEIKKSLPGITNTMLAATLKELEKAELVKRVQYNEIPPHVDYLLSEKGAALLPIFFEMAKWGEAYLE